MVPVRLTQEKLVRSLPSEFPFPFGVKGEGQFKNGRDAFEIQGKRLGVPPLGGLKRRFYQLRGTAKKGYVTNTPPLVDR